MDGWFEENLCLKIVGFQGKDNDGSCVGVLDEKLVPSVVVDSPRDPPRPPAPGGRGGPPWWRSRGITAGDVMERGGCSQSGNNILVDVSLGGEKGSHGSMNPHDGFHQHEL